jgi:hypothetical protein
MSCICSQRTSHFLLDFFHPVKHRLDLVQPEEVYIFSKDQEGAAHAQRMSELPDVKDMLKHFNPGEIWTNLLEPGLLGQDVK